MKANKTQITRTITTVVFDDENEKELLKQALNTILASETLLNGEEFDVVDNLWIELNN